MMILLQEMWQFAEAPVNMLAVCPCKVGLMLKCPFYSHFLQEGLGTHKTSELILSNLSNVS